MRFVGIKDVVSQATPFNLGEKAVVERVGAEIGVVVARLWWTDYIPVCQE